MFSKGNPMSKELVISTIIIVGLCFIHFVQATPTFPLALSVEDIDWEIQVKFEKTDRWRAILNITLTSNADKTIHIPWVYLNFIAITYVDNSSEEWGIVANFTTNYSIDKNQTYSLSPITFTERGFDKEPREIEIEIEIFILEAAESIKIGPLVIRESSTNKHLAIKLKGRWKQCGAITLH